MKKMIYKNDRIVDLLAMGAYKDFTFYVLNLGTHPTAYVEIPKGHKLFNKDYHKIDIDVHGGLTYSSDILYIVNNTVLNNSWFIGWDYAHLGDYVGFLDSIGGKKWTTNEMIEECKNVIDQIIDKGF